MPLITPFSISEAIPLPLADDGEPDGNAEKAAGPAFTREARIYLRSVLGADKVTEIEGWEGNADADKAGAYAALSQAASILAYAAALPGLNLRAIPKGGIVTSTGYEANRVELLGPREIALMQAELRARAALLIADYPAPDEPAPFRPPIVRSLRGAYRC